MKHLLLKEKQENINLRQCIIKGIGTFVVAGLVILAFSISFDKCLIINSSMEPTLMTGDIVIYQSLFKKANRGDIIEFRKDAEIHSKRVIGIAGDEISFSDDDKVIRNGEKLEEEYLPSGTVTIPVLMDSYKVPEGSVFVLGDNRTNSFDSRFWEDPFVKTSDIIGKYFATVKRRKE